MNNTLKKIARGTLALFIIKLVLIGGFFVIQSCQKDDNINIINDQAKTEFLASLQESIFNLNSVKVKNTEKDTIENITESRSTKQETAIVCLIDPPKDEEIDGFGKVLQVAIDWDLVITEVDNGNPSIDCYEVLVQDIQQALNPSVTAARQFLLSRGYTNTDLNEILNGEDSSILIPLVQTVIAVEEDSIDFTFNDNLNFLIGVQIANAQTDWVKVGKCAKQALGLDILEGFKDWKKLGKKARKKILKKAVYTAAAKFGSGAIGIALVVAEFAICASFK